LDRVFVPSRIWLAVWAVVLFVSALALNTRHNTFPYFYHPDEGEKAAQLLTGKWNFHHPMLLLTTTKTVIDLAHVRQREQAVVEAGRWVSAGFTALAIVALSLLGYAWRGWKVCVASGAALLLHHQLYELSHYLKEDTALLAGMSFTFLTAYLYWQKPGGVAASLLGLSVAAAISGKYLGIMSLAVAGPVLWFAPGPRKASRFFWFGGALLLALLVVNLPLVLSPAAFGQSLDREVGLAVGGQRGTTRSIPHALYWNIFRDNTTPVMWGLLLAFLFGRWRERRSLTLVEWLIIAFPFVYALALSFSPKSNDRYFLPATGLFTLFTAVGVLDASRVLAPWIKPRWSVLALGLALVAAQIPSWLRYEAAFQRDDNRELFEWVKAKLPPEAVIVKDSRVQLPDPKSTRVLNHFGPLPQTVIAKKYAADYGSIREARKKGVTHVAVSDSDFGRFFLRGLRPKKDDAEDFARRKSFYKKLLRDGELLFVRDRGTVLYLHPGLRLYRMPLPEE
jgi:hypothetical protein